jgi:kynurenine formamidase
MCLSTTLEAAHQHAIDAPPQAQPAGGHAPAGRIPRRQALFGAAVAALGVASPAPAWSDRRRAHHRVQDLTHVFRAGFPMYAGDAPRRRTILTIPANRFYVQAWSFGEHSGTHLDAPGHFTLGARLGPELDPADLFAPVAVIDIADRAAADPDAMVEPRDLRAFERRHGRIPSRAIVAMYSGWERRAHDADAYRNQGADGRFHFPGFGVDAVEWLLGRRDITAIGVDTLSLDIGVSATFAVHGRLLGADRYGLENLANLQRIPPNGAEVVVGLVPWEQGSGGPCRVLARW